MPGALDRAKQVAEIVKIIMMPLLLLVGAIMFFGPIKELVDLVPERVRTASKVTAGASGFSWEIEQAAQDRGNPRLAKLLSGLPEEAIRNLIAFDPDGRGVDGRITLWSGPPVSGKRTFSHLAPHEFAAWKELETRNLISCEKPLAEWQTLLDEVLVPENQSQPSNGKVTKPHIEEPYQVTFERLDNLCKLTRNGSAAVDLLVEVISREISVPDTQVVKTAG